MDQLKPYLLQLKKHHFWVISGLIPIIALVTWWMSAGKLDAETSVQQSAIQAKKANLQGASANEYPPQTAEVKFNEAQQKAQENVLQVWKALYDRQQNFMQWPVEFANIADKEKSSTEFPDTLRNGYRLVIWDSEFAKVIDRLNVRRPKQGAETRRTTPGATPAAASADQDGLVEFDVPRRTAIRARYIGDKTPSSNRVRVMQEDIWLYDNLAWVIQETNSDSRDVGEVAVESIIDMDVGRFAVSASAPQKPAADPAADPAAAPAFTDDDWSLIGGRYLDESSNPTIDHNRFSEFRQVPVKLKLIIDQRRVQEFLVNCANAPLMIEPRKLTLSPAAQASGQKTPANAAAAAAGTHFVTLDFSGVTYIYNPSAVELLGKGNANPTGVRDFTFPVATEKQVVKN